MYADFDFHCLSFHLQSECLCKTFPMKIMKVTWFSCGWLYRWHHIFIPIVSHKDSFCHRGKSKLGIGLFIHELLREPLINPNLDFFLAVKVKKSGHHLFHDRASKGYGCVSGKVVWCHKLLCIHVYKHLIRCKSVCDVKPGIDLCPLLAWLYNRWLLDF